MSNFSQVSNGMVAWEVVEQLQEKKHATKFFQINLTPNIHDATA